MASPSQPSPSSSSDSHTYIFGYGSLTWRPSDDLKNSPSFLGLLSVGDLSTGPSDPFVRVWSQRSTDHRGCDSSHPGVVCDLLTLSELRSFYQSWYGAAYKPSYLEPYLRQLSASASVIAGTLYRLEPAEAERILSDLDDRESGGYSRSVVPVSLYPLDGSSPSLSSPPSK